MTQIKKQKGKSEYENQENSSNAIRNHFGPWNVCWMFKEKG